jgi:protein-tyrosine phosphatase
MNNENNHHALRLDLGRPLFQSYRVCGENIFAGEYPGDKNEEDAEDKIRQMTEFGVRHYIDLTEEGELKPYAHLLPADATYTRFPIRDVSVPKSIDEVKNLVEHIRELSERNDGHVYIHCWGGVGRTGTIVACYLAHLMEHPTSEKALARLRSRFIEMPKSSYRLTPETRAQEQFVKDYIQSIL